MRFSVFILSSSVISSQPLHQLAVRLISASTHIEFRTSDMLSYFLFRYSSFLFSSLQFVNAIPLVQATSVIDLQYHSIW